MFLASDPAIDCVKVQLPAEMTLVIRLALATSEARVCVCQDGVSIGRWM